MKEFTRTHKRKLFLFVALFATTLVASVVSFQIQKKLNGQYIRDFKKGYRVFSIDIPDDLNFAGEQVPLNDFEVRENADREFLINTYWQSQSILFLKRSNRWFKVIEPILKRNNIPDDFKYLAIIESGLTNASSKAGAIGFWQFIDATARENGLQVDEEVDERYDVEKSTQAACNYFKNAYEKYHNWTMVAAAYNMGTTGLNKQVDLQKVTNYYDLLLNSETSRYVFRILAAKEIMMHPKRYGFYVRKKDLYPVIPTKQIGVDSTITNLVDFAFQHEVNYKILKIFNPWLRKNSLTNPDKKKYYIKLPVKGYENYETLYETEGYGLENKEDSTMFYNENDSLKF